MPAVDYQALPTGQTWENVANKQAYDQMTMSYLNSETLPTTVDPIYQKLVMQINDSIYHKMRYEQNWYDLGTTRAPQEYPGIMRELAMSRRKGKNFAMDADPRPDELGVYPIVDDDITVRYHAAQFRWMYEYTTFQQELKRFAQGPSTIGQLHEMKAIAASSARNIYMDALRKKTLAILETQVATKLSFGVDLSSSSLTQSDARRFLLNLKELQRELYWGTAKYNGLGELIQTPRDRLQIVIPHAYYENLINAAFPQTISKTEVFTDVMPRNIILIDNLGDVVPAQLTGTSPNQVLTPITPTWSADGTNQLDWTSSSLSMKTSNIQCVIMDSFAMGFEDNLNITLPGAMDARKLATPWVLHYWSGAYISEMVASIALTI